MIEIVKCCSSCKHWQMDSFDWGMCEKLKDLVDSNDGACGAYDQCEEKDLPDAYFVYHSAPEYEEEE